MPAILAKLRPSIISTNHVIPLSPAKPTTPKSSKQTTKMSRDAPKVSSVDVIVALTTWKGRISHENFPLNLWSLLHQKTKYKYKVVLTLSEEEFGTQYQPPISISALTTKFDHFEILFTGRNTKALKNYNPVNRKYPDTPIIVIGDDTIYDEALVETVYETYLHSDQRTAFGAFLANSSPKYGILSPFRIRIFPPNSMYDLDEYYFEKYFYGHNDLFNGLRLRLNKTNVQKANWTGLWHSAFAQDVRLTDYHRIPESDIIEDFLRDHPQIKDMLH